MSLCVLGFLSVFSFFMVCFGGLWCLGFVFCVFCFWCVFFVFFFFFCFGWFFFVFFLGFVVFVCFVCFLVGVWGGVLGWCVGLGVVVGGGGFLLIVFVCGCFC